VLGESESIGKFTALFEPINKKNFIYTKKKAQPRVNFGFESASSYVARAAVKESGKKDSISLLRDEMDKLLITEYVPAALLINSNLDILVFRGNVTPYLSPESGQISFNIAKMVRKELRAEVQTAVYRAKKDFPKIKADHSYLQRILINLSNNAIQAMPNGGELTISSASDNGKATITVQDTGVGIPEFVKSKIFTPLVTTKVTGQGFGLAAVKRFTEAMGGTVTFESEVGKEQNS
jgi:signal transduction histidine kinase